MWRSLPRGDIGRFASIFASHRWAGLVAPPVTWMASLRGTRRWIFIEVRFLVENQAADDGGENLLSRGLLGQAAKFGLDRLQRVPRAHQVGDIGHAAVAVKPRIDGAGQEVAEKIPVGQLAAEDALEPFEGLARHARS